jgi:Group II intron, maturase-specific domain
MVNLFWPKEVKGTGFSKMIKKLAIHKWINKDIQFIANALTPKIRGCINYYGKFRLSEMQPLFRALALGVKSVKKSCMMGDCQVRFCERLEVKLPRSTRQYDSDSLKHIFKNRIFE